MRIKTYSGFIFKSARNKIKKGSEGALFLGQCGVYCPPAGPGDGEGGGVVVQDPPLELPDEQPLDEPPLRRLLPLVRLGVLPPLPPATTFISASDKTLITFSDLFPGPGSCC